MNKLRIKGPVMDDAGRMYRVVVEENGFQLARFYGRDSLGDAKLFIAAPEMLAALKHAQMKLRGFHLKQDEPNFAALDAVEDAIKKAEGRRE